MVSTSPVVKPHLLEEGRGLPVPGLTWPEYGQPPGSFLETWFSAQKIHWAAGSGSASEDGVPRASYDHMGAEKQLNFSTTRDPTGGRVGVQVHAPPPNTHPSLLKLTGKPAIREPIPGQVLAFWVAFAQGGFPHLCTFALLSRFPSRVSAAEARFPLEGVRAPRGLWGCREVFTSSRVGLTVSCPKTVSTPATGGRNVSQLSG